MPEATGINISFNISDYNHFTGGVDHVHTLGAPKQQCEGEDVLR